MYLVWQRSMTAERWLSVLCVSHDRGSCHRRVENVVDRPPLTSRGGSEIDHRTYYDIVPSIYLSRERLIGHLNNTSQTYFLNNVFEEIRTY